MTLRCAVSKILSRDVTDKEAKEFAFNQYGVLCAFIRSEAFKKISKDKIGEYRYMAITNEICYGELIGEDAIVGVKESVINKDL